MAGSSGVSVDLDSKGDEGKIDLTGLPLLPMNPEAAPEVGSIDSSPQLGGEEVSGIVRRREGNEAIVEGEVGPVSPPSRSDLGISKDDRGPSGGT